MSYSSIYFTSKSAVGCFNFFVPYLLQVYGEGSGYECRKHVQHLNLMRKTMDEQEPVGSDEGHCMWHEVHTVAVADVDNAPNHVMNYTVISVIYFMVCLSTYLR